MMHIGVNKPELSPIWTFRLLGDFSVWGLALYPLGTLTLGHFALVTFAHMCSLPFGYFVFAGLCPSGHYALRRAMPFGALCPSRCFALWDSLPIGRFWTLLQRTFCFLSYFLL